jgi:hypothetical protein
MELVNHPHRPNRTVIRCKAKMQLLDSMTDCAEWIEPDFDTLLSELATTLFQSDRYQQMYQQCRSKQEAQMVGDRLVNELAQTFQAIVERQQDPVVQHLNTLL